MLSIERELVDVTNFEYFVDTQRKYLSYETEDNKLKTRYEKHFVKSAYKLGKNMDEIIVTFNKFITFEIEGIIKIRMSIPIKISYFDGKYYPNYNSDDDLIAHSLRNATVKSINYIENDIIYSELSAVLNEIRSKVFTKYNDNNRDFIVDFFENCYKKNIFSIIKTLSLTHFEECIVKKYGNSYSILYNDLDNFKANNITYDEFNQNESLFSTFSEIDLFYLVDEVKGISEEYYNELEPITCFQQRANRLEKTLFSEYENGITETEKEYNLMYMSTVIDFKVEMIHIPAENFSAEVAISLLNHFGVLELFKKRNNDIMQEFLENRIFLKEVIDHYLSLTIFAINSNEIQVAYEKYQYDLKNDEVFQNNRLQ